MIPSSRNTVKIVFSSSSPSPKSPPSKSPVKNALQHHVFLSTLDDDDSLMNETLSQDQDENISSNSVGEIDSDFNLVRPQTRGDASTPIEISPAVNKTSRSTSVVSESSNSSGTMPRPSLIKQYNDIHLLVTQYYHFIRCSIMEAMSYNDVLDYSNYDEFSNDEKISPVRTHAIPTVLYLIDAKWYLEWEKAATREAHHDYSIDDPAIFDCQFEPIDNASLIKAPNNPRDRKSTTLKGAPSYTLKPDLIEGHDYVLIPKESWNALKSWYGGGNIAICRKGYVIVESIPDVNLSISQPLHLISNTMNITSTHVTMHITGTKLVMELYPQKPFTEDDATIFHDMATSSHQNYMKTSISPTKLDRSGIQPTSPLSTLSRTDSFSFSRSASATAPFKLSSYIFQDVGVIQSEVKARCYVCHENSKFRCSKCASVHYCNQTCQRIHWKYHKGWCHVAVNHKDLPSQQFNSVVSTGKRGKVGMHNLGNSCYMNSSLQCISHISPLVSFLLSERFKNELNKDNRDGTGGVLTNELHDLFKELWLDWKTAISPVGKFLNISLV